MDRRVLEPDSRRSPAGGEPAPETPAARDPWGGDEPTVRLDVERARGPRPRRAARRTAAALAVVAGLLLAVPLVSRGLDLLPDLSNPLAPRTVDSSGPALLVALEDLGEYHAARASFSELIDLERDTPYVPSLVSGERTTYLAVGHVDGIVDLSGIGPGSVRVSDDGRAVSISLPAARLGDAVVDPEQSRVVSRDRGLLDRLGGVFEDSPTSEQEVMTTAAARLEAAAAQSDLLERAEADTRRTLTELARGLGYTDVTVTFDQGARL